MSGLNIVTLHKFRDWIKPCAPVYLVLWRAPVWLWRGARRVRGWLQRAPDRLADACWRGTYWLMFDWLVWRQRLRARTQTDASAARQVDSQ